MLLAHEGHVGHRQPLLPHRRGHHLGLIRRHHLVVQALQQDERAVQLVHGVNRRPRAIGGLHGGIRPHEPIHVARLELVGVARQHFEIADAVVAGAGLERVVERQRRERRVAAGAAAARDEPRGVRLPRRHQVRGRIHGIAHVHDAPLAVQPLAIGAAIAGAAAVVHVDHGEAAGRPELHFWVEHRVGGAGRTAVAQHEQRRYRAGRRAEAAIGGRIVEGMHRQAGAVEGDGLGHRHEQRVELVVARAFHHLGFGAAERHARHGRAPSGRPADEVGRTRRGHHRVERLDRQLHHFERGRADREQPQAPTALVGIRHHEAIRRRERVGAGAQAPLRLAEVGRHRVHRLGDLAAAPIEVPPARAIRDEIQQAIG